MSRSYRWCGLALIGLVFGLASFVGAANLPGDQGSFALKARHSGQCLNVAGAYTTNGTPVVQWPCSQDGGNDHWRLSPYGTGFMLVAENSAKCLTVAGGSTIAGAGLIQQDCTKASEQLWNFKLISGAYRVINQRSGQCANVAGAAQGYGSAVIQWPCDTNNNGLWELIPQGTFQVISDRSSHCMDVSYASTGDSVPISEWDCWGGDNQRFALVKWSPYLPEYQLVAKSSGKCLNVANASTSPGATVVQYPCVGAPNDRWRLLPWGRNFMLQGVQSGLCLDGGADHYGSPTELFLVDCNDFLARPALLWTFNSGTWITPPATAPTMPSTPGTPTTPTKPTPAPPVLTGVDQLADGTFGVVGYGFKANATVTIVATDDFGDSFPFYGTSSPSGLLSYTTPPLYCSGARTYWRATDGVGTTNVFEYICLP